MCYGQLFEESLRRARKAHRCHLCGDSISQGTRYIAQFGSFEGEAQFTKMCLACAATVRLEQDAAGPGSCVYYGEERAHREFLVEEHGWRGALAILRGAAKRVRERFARRAQGETKEQS